MVSQLKTLVALGCLLVVSAFRAARLRGAGAEECMTTQSLATFADGHCVDADLDREPGPTVL